MSILADFEGLGILDAAAALFAVPLGESGAGAGGFLGGPIDPSLFEPGPAARLVAGRRDAADIRLAAARAPFVMLRGQLVNRVQLLLEDVVDGHGDVHFERIRFLKIVARKEED